MALRELVFEKGFACGPGALCQHSQEELCLAVEQCNEEKAALDLARELALAAARRMKS